MFVCFIFLQYFYKMVFVYNKIYYRLTKMMCICLERIFNKWILHNIPNKSSLMFDVYRFFSRLAFHTVVTCNWSVISTTRARIILLLFFTNQLNFWVFIQIVCLNKRARPASSANSIEQLLFSDFSIRFTCNFIFLRLPFDACCYLYSSARMR